MLDTAIKLSGNDYYRDAVGDRERHHGRLSETQEATYAVFILRVKKHFGQLDTDLKKHITNHKT